MSLENSKQSCFEYALSLVGGNLTLLGRLAGCTPQAVAQWKRRGVVPVKRVPALARALKTRRSALNPIFGKD